MSNAIPDRLFLLTEQIAREYAAGEGYTILCGRYKMQHLTLGAILRLHGVKARRRGGSVGHGWKMRAVDRIPCPHGKKVMGAVKLCVMANDGVCDACQSMDYAHVGICSDWDEEYSMGRMR